jgi:hypothetical protein
VDAVNERCVEKNAEVRVIDEPEDNLSCLGWALVTIVALIALDGFWTKIILLIGGTP